MLSKSFTRIVAGAVLLATLALSVVTPALAFDGRSGDDVKVAAGEVINDDLYVTGQTLVMDGTVKGDVVVFAKTITINGTVEGDVIGAGQDIIINGTVGGAVRIAGAALYLGEKAKIGTDLIGASASLEARKGSTIGRDLVFAGGQALLSGNVARNVNATASGLQLAGLVGGNLTADVGNPDQGHNTGTHAYLPNSTVSIPVVKTGLNIDPAAKIGGSLEYTSSKPFDIAAGVVTGKVTRLEPKADETLPKPPTLTEQILDGTLNAIRLIITLLLFGLLLGWLFPGFMSSTTGHLQVAPLLALGEGVLSIAAFCFALFALIVVIIIGAIVFGVLTLGQVTGTIIVLGLLAIFALILGFVLAVSFIAQIVVSILSGRMILARIRPDLAASRYWPLALGVVIFGILSAIPILGVFVNLIAVLFGLGAIWHIGRLRLMNQPTAAPLPQPAA